MKKFTLDKQTFDGGAFLVHGLYGAGKTAFVGDALRTLSANGPVLFVNLASEDGYASLSGSGLDGMTLESLAELEAFAKECEKKPYYAIAYDSLLTVSRFVQWDICGKKRPPRGGRSDENEYPKLHTRFTNIVNDLKRCARWTFWTCPTKKIEHMIENEWQLTPALPGAQATDCIGLYDFVMYVESRTDRKGTTRTLYVRPMPRGDEDNPAIVTRQRLAKTIKEDIVLPEGPGSWTAFETKIEEAMR